MSQAVKYTVPAYELIPNTIRPSEMGQKNYGWSKGVMRSGRSYYGEFWNIDCCPGFYVMIYYFSTQGLEDLDAQGLLDLLVVEELIRIRSFLNLGDKWHVDATAEKEMDEANNEMWVVAIPMESYDDVHVDCLHRIHRYQDEILDTYYPSVLIDEEMNQRINAELKEVDRKLKKIPGTFEYTELQQRKNEAKRMRKNPKTSLTGKFNEALIYAAITHVNQYRKQTKIPYISHLLATSGAVLEYGGTEDEAIAALLHDAAEDQGGIKTLEEIRCHFGDTIAEIVAGCSDDMPSEEGKKRPWNMRKTEHMEHLKDASYSVLLVSMADKIHNLRTILADLEVQEVHQVWERFNATPDESLWYFKKLYEICETRAILPLGMVRVMKGLIEALEKKVDRSR